MSLFQYLVDVKFYSESDAEETCLRFYHGFPLPDICRKDCSWYYQHIL